MDHGYDPMTHLLSMILNAALVMGSIFIHYEALNRLSRLMPVLPFKPRARIIFGVVGALLAHSLEVALFALGFLVGSQLGYGELSGHFDHSFGDYMYFSYSTFTTVGFGDIVPEGHLRWLTGIESLTGFVLITWTASYMYLEMAQNWRHD